MRYYATTGIGFSCVMQKLRLHQEMRIQNSRDKRPTMPILRCQPTGEPAHRRGGQSLHAFWTWRTVVLYGGGLSSTDAVGWEIGSTRAGKSAAIHTYTQGVWNQEDEGHPGHPEARLGGTLTFDTVEGQIPPLRPPHQEDSHLKPTDTGVSHSGPSERDHRLHALVCVPGALQSACRRRQQLKR
ncbi:hypothetical protein BC827DRAFT_820190 [Russula dissimulans]|nr:hypothetical protein BC827DRAFT_820190 [Russula dissimulans]